MRILVSGFEPFLDEKVNPSAEIVRFVNTCPVEDRVGWKNLEVRGIVLPVVFGQAFIELEKHRKAFQPDAILSFGLAGGRKTFDIEQVALNFRGENTGAAMPDAGNVARPDNNGVVGQGVIVVGAPLSLSTTLPTEQMMRSLSAAGIPTQLSYSAGTYVCNSLFFSTQHSLRETSIRSGFIHVPRLATDDATVSDSAWVWSRFEVAIHAILRSFAAE